MDRELSYSLRWFRILRHQHDIVPFRQWGTLRVHCDIDEKRFRRRLRELNPGFAFVVFIERTKRGDRNHYHLVSQTYQTKKDFRNYLIDVLSPRKNCKAHRKSISRMINLQYEDLEPSKECAAFAYLAKVDKKDRRKLVKLSGHIRFQVGHVWSKPTPMLGNMTEEEIEKRLQNRLMIDQFLLLDIFEGYVTTEQLRKASFLNWYDRDKETQHRKYLRSMGWL